MLSRISSELIGKICSVIEIGVSFASACHHAGIELRMGKIWLSRGEAEEEGLYAEFYQRVKQAEANAEINSVIELTRHEKTDWKAAKFKLQARYPEAWTLPDQKTPGVLDEAAFLEKLKGKLPADVLAKIEGALREEEHKKTYEDPALFAVEVLGINLWSKQAQIARAIAKHKRVAARSGHKIGKSILAAAVALWWVHDRARRPTARVVITAPTDRQVRSIVWKEVRKLYRRADARGYNLGGKINLDPGTGLQLADGREVIGFATDDDTRIAGYSGEDILFIVDEASGVAPCIFEAIEGNRAGGGSLLMLGNPTSTSGDFYDAFDTKRHLYDTYQIASYETPNATGGEHIPGLATRAYCEEKKEEWGEDDPRYQVRVAGNPPSDSDCQVIGLSIVREAIARWQCDPEEGALVFGLDPARFGDDDSILCARQGKKALLFKKLPKGDGPTTARAAFAEIKKICFDNGAPLEDQDRTKTRVCVDVIGIGASVYDALKEGYSDFLNVVSVNVSQVSSRPDEYINLRDQLWFQCRDWLKRGGSIPDLGALRQELIAPAYSFAKNGACKVEPKDDIKKRIGRSPDHAEALLMSLYERKLQPYSSVR